MQTNLVLWYRRPRNTLYAIVTAEGVEDRGDLMCGAPERHEFPCLLERLIGRQLTVWANETPWALAHFVGLDRVRNYLRLVGSGVDTRRRFNSTMRGFELAHAAPFEPTWYEDEQPKQIVLSSGWTV